MLLKTILFKICQFLKSTNSGINGIIPNKELLTAWLKEIGYDTLGSYYVAVNYKYRFLPNVNFEELYVRSEDKTHYYINVIKTNPDQKLSIFEQIYN